MKYETKTALVAILRRVNRLEDAMRRQDGPYKSSIVESYTEEAANILSGASTMLIYLDLDEFLRVEWFFHRKTAEVYALQRELLNY